VVAQQHGHRAVALAALDFGLAGGAERPFLRAYRRHQRRGEQGDQHHQRPGRGAGRDPFGRGDPGAEDQDMKHRRSRRGAVQQQDPAEQHGPDDREGRMAIAIGDPRGQREADRPGERAEHERRIDPPPLPFEQREIVGLDPGAQPDQDARADDGRGDGAPGQQQRPVGVAGVHRQQHQD
jgi:hypothetical protein